MTTNPQNCDRHDKSDELDTGWPTPAPPAWRSRSEEFAARNGRPKPGKRRDNIWGENPYQGPKMGCAACKAACGGSQVVWFCYRVGRPSSSQTEQKWATYWLICWARAGFRPLPLQFSIPPVNMCHLATSSVGVVLIEFEIQTTQHKTSPVNFGFKNA